MVKKRKTFNTASLKSKAALEKNFPLLRIIYLSLILNIMTIVLIFIFQSRLPPEVPLFYGLPEGPAQLTNRQNLAIPSILSILFILFNTVIVYLIKNDFLKRTLIITGLVISIFAFTTTLKIMLLVGNF